METANDMLYKPSTRGAKDSSIPRRARQSNAGTERTVIVPILQRMQPYILRHHKRLLLHEINRQLDGGLLAEERQGLPEDFKIRVEHCCFMDMCFWRDDARRLLADVPVVVKASVEDRVWQRELYAELWIDMRKGMTVTCGEVGLLREKPARDMWMLSNFLVPILRKDEIEQGAEALLRRYCPDALSHPHCSSAAVLAQRMGLEVVHIPLHRRARTRSILFFSGGTVTAAEEDETGHLLEEPHAVAIASDTIVINTNAVRKNGCQMDIYHECIHYDWHFMFFRLQEMHLTDVNRLSKRHVIAAKGDVPPNPLNWMEWQARRGAYALFLPRAQMTAMLTAGLCAKENSSQHMGKRLDALMRETANEWNVPWFRMRARVIQMGYAAAWGALNYVDGRYIEPFAFCLSNGGGTYSFVIDRESAFEIYQKDEDFRTRINSGRYVHADGHICIHDPRFVRQTPFGYALTPWANAHVDACCLRFVSSYEDAGIPEYSYGELNSDEEYNRHYLTFGQIGDAPSEREKFSAVTRTIDALPASFHDTLTFLMKQANMSIEQLEEAAQISSRTISRLRTEERDTYSLDQVMALCIALHLPPWLSPALLSRAGLVLRSTKRHSAYQYILNCLFMDSVPEVQRFLDQIGEAPLKLNDPALREHSVPPRR